MLLTAEALAADRSTKFLPIIVAQAFFIGSVVIAVWKTASKQSGLSTFINVEAHSIAFSALYFWVIPTVLLSSVIGVSQSELAIPRILRRFQVDLDRHPPTEKVKLPNHVLEQSKVRIFSGGIYSWLPASRAKAKSDPHNFKIPASPSLDSFSKQNANFNNWRQCSTPLLFRSSSKDWSYCKVGIFSNLIVILGMITGILISILVPPDGWTCRNVAQLLIPLLWFLSAQFDTIIECMLPSLRQNQTLLFRAIGLKDLLVTLATMGGIVVTQIGVFNQCSCYTRWGKTGLALPEMPDVAYILVHRLSTVYPAIAFFSIGTQLIIIPLFVCIRYRHAVRVYLQRDDAESNAPWFWRLHQYCWLQTRGRSVRVRRSQTSLAEDGFDCREKEGSMVTVQRLTEECGEGLERHTDVSTDPMEFNAAATKNSRHRDSNATLVHGH